LRRADAVMVMMAVAALRCAALRRECHAVRPGALPSPQQPLPRMRSAPLRRSRVAQLRCTRVVSASLVAGEPAALAALTAVAATAWQLERHTALGRRASAPLLAMAIAAAVTAAITPGSAADAALCAAVARVWAFVVPFALALTLLATDLRLLVRSRDAVLAFACAALGTLAGTAVAFAACARALGPAAWQLAACLCASYIGGSVNFAATAAALGMLGANDALTSPVTMEAIPGCMGHQAGGRALIAAAMALDNLMMALFLAALLAWPAPRPESVEGADSTAAAALDAADEPVPAGARVLGIVAACCVAAACCVCADAAASALRFPGAALALVAVLAAAASALASALSRRPAAASLGPGFNAVPAALLLLFFAALGASAGPAAALQVGPAAAAFIALQLGVHLAVTLAAGAALRLPRHLLLLASNAAVGGPATAAAMASARGWADLAPAAVLLGTLGYLVGTAAGVAVGALLLRWQTAGVLML
jgi:uncharacterized membrane protein